MQDAMQNKIAAAEIENSNSYYGYTWIFLRQMYFKPAILVFLIAIYVVTVFIGCLSNIRALIFLASRRKRRSSEQNNFFITQSLEMDVAILCVCSLFCTMCFVFVLFDLTYGQWIAPTRSFCQFYHYFDLFWRSMIGMTLMHFATLHRRVNIFCDHTQQHQPVSGRSDNCDHSDHPDQLDLSVSINRSWICDRFYAYFLTPVCALCTCALASAFGRTNEAKIDTIDHFDHSSNRTLHAIDHEQISVAACSMSMIEPYYTIFAAFTFVIDYFAPAMAFAMASAAFFHKNTPQTEDVHVKRYKSLYKRYAILFSFCNTPNWLMSLFLYFTMGNKRNDSNFTENHAIATVDYLAYFAHILTYASCVGFPVMYFRALNENRICAEPRLKRDETIASLSSSYLIGQLARDQSRDLLLANRNTRTISCTFSTLTSLNAESVCEKRDSYQSLLIGPCNEEDEF